ncbi:helix-turn-helix protein [Melghirimyces profundicolus]|uniref:Helix-turn-helix protein n=1 Tax=Melghirimyces profundicolus TaxID=1242148 RepID=A0A2T6BT80_9BACL|nr:helix-turn-helix domain-containing protein [Melghirimyces profundicolus]PTX59167.1 helix-turn-helix protein [Melghirimyces profundicolus]
MAKKGQKYKHYPFLLKMQAVQMRLQGVTKREVAKRLGIYDVGRLKVWLRQYKLKGSKELQDRRGGRKRPLERDEYVRQLELENDVLKKWWEIQRKEG